MESSSSAPVAAGTWGAPTAREGGVGSGALLGSGALFGPGGLLGCCLLPLLRGAAVLDGVGGVPGALPGGPGRRGVVGGHGRDDRLGDDRQ
nr:hypothetical protein [Schaalia georgiae]